MDASGPHSKFEQLTERASLLASRHEYASAAKLLEQALETARTRRSDVDTRRALHHLGICYFEMDRVNEARTCFEEALAIAKAQNEPQKESLSLHELSQVHWKLGDLPTAIAMCERSLKLALDTGDEGAIQLHTLSILYYENGQYPKAKRVLETVKESCEARQDWDGLGKALNELGLTCFQMESYRESFDYLVQSIHLKRQMGDEHGAKVTFANMVRQVLMKPFLASDPEIKAIIATLSE